MHDNVPSLESLVNQCCEDYYNKLTDPSSSSAALNSNNNNNNSNSFSYQKFRDFITSSHCQENLKFLIEIYHYEKIWNRIFKRQSSILKCKDENARKQSIHELRKQSVHSIIRRQSIAEVPEERMDSIHSLDENDIKNLVNDLTATDLNADQQQPQPNKDENDHNEHQDHHHHQHKHNHSQNSLDPVPLRASHSNPQWNSLFKVAYCEPQHECECNEHENTPSESEFNESILEFEIREQLKDELFDKFQYIITYYVLNNSPYEINLPNDVYANLVKEYENSKILYHSPLVLLPAKVAVLQLLRENIYYKFLSQQERQIEETSKVTITSTAPKKDVEIELTSTSDPIPITAPSPVNSKPSFEMKRASTPVSSLSNFLNKYHIKFPNNSAPSTSNNSSNSSVLEKELTFSVSPDDKTEIHQGTRELKFETNNNNNSIINTIPTHPHRHDIHSIKAPCGVEPTLNDFSPSPPKHQHNWGKVFKFKKRKS